jgi:two-component system phosphate regulon response regulator PhoB
MAKARVLIVEDDRSLSDVLAYNLQQAGYDTSIARDGQDGLNQARHKNFDLIILDLMLPVVDGLEVCRRLRADATVRDMRIVMLTAKSEEADQVVGLAIGADDYVTKPFSVKVLLERVKALLRRRSTELDDRKIVASHGVIVDRHRHSAMAGESPLQLTRSEFSLLDTLIRQPGRAFTRSELIDSALGETIVLERTIDVHIRSLRRKLDRHAELIETVRGVGYRFRDTRVESDSLA